MKMKKVRMEAFEILFRIKGFYFHYGQAGWRQVQKIGGLQFYTVDKKFRNFVWRVLALPFLPVNQLIDAVDRLTDEDTFDDDDEDQAEKIEMKRKLMQYVQDTWMRGNFAPMVLYFFNF